MTPHSHQTNILYLPFASSTYVLLFATRKRYFPTPAWLFLSNLPSLHCFFPNGGLARFRSGPWWTRVCPGREEINRTHAPSEGGTEEGKLGFSNALNDGLSRSCQEGTGALREGMGTETDWYFPPNIRFPDSRILNHVYYLSQFIPAIPCCALSYSSDRLWRAGKESVKRKLKSQKRPCNRNTMEYGFWFHYRLASNEKK